MKTMNKEEMILIKLNELLENGMSITKAKKKLGIYNMISYGELEKTTMLKINEISENHRVLKHLKK